MMVDNFKAVEEVQGMWSLSGHSSLIVIYIGLGYGKASC